MTPAYVGQEVTLWPLAPHATARFTLKQPRGGELTRMHKAANRIRAHHRA